MSRVVAPLSSLCEVFMYPVQFLAHQRRQLTAALQYWIADLIRTRC